jgi:hypothetical protein
VLVNPTVTNNTDNSERPASQAASGPSNDTTNNAGGASEGIKVSSYSQRCFRLPNGLIEVMTKLCYRLPPTSHPQYGMPSLSGIPQPYMQPHNMQQPFMGPPSLQQPYQDPPSAASVPKTKPRAFKQSRDEEPIGELVTRNCLRSLPTRNCPRSLVIDTARPSSFQSLQIRLSQGKSWSFSLVSASATARQRLRELSLLFTFRVLDRYHYSSFLCYSVHLRSLSLCCLF